MGNLQSSDQALKVSAVASKLVDVLMPIGSSSMVIARFSFARFSVEFISGACLLQDRLLFTHYLEEKIKVSSINDKSLRSASWHFPYSIYLSIRQQHV